MINNILEKTYKVCKKDLLILIEENSCCVSVRFIFNNYDILIIDSYQLGDSTTIKACDIVDEFNKELHSSRRYKELTKTQYSRLVTLLDNKFEQYKDKHRTF